MALHVCFKPFQSLFLLPASSHPFPQHWLSTGVFGIKAVPTSVVPVPEKLYKALCRPPNSAHVLNQPLRMKAHHFLVVTHAAEINHTLL